MKTGKNTYRAKEEMKNCVIPIKIFYYCLGTYLVDENNKFHRKETWESLE